MLVYDFEVFKHDWLVCIYNIKTREMTEIINDHEQLSEFYRDHKYDLWIGWNNKGYDQYIMQAILCGFNPKEINDFIIIKQCQGWQFSNQLKRFPFNNYDVKWNREIGLKQVEGFMGSNIKETSVPFDIDRKLTEDEIDLTLQYCRHDVMQTFEIFLNCQDDYKAQLGLVKMFDLPFNYLSKTKAQISAAILDAKLTYYYDEFDVDLPPTLQLDKYRHVAEWYLDPANHKYRKNPDNPNSDRHQLITEVAGIQCAFGWGGAHGAIPNHHEEGYLLNMDVASLYPSLMIEYDLHSRSCDPTKYIDIYDKRLGYKAAKNPLQAPLKIVLNATYGAMKAQGNPLYDPRQNNRVVIYGQLLLLDLVEKLEPHAKIIQINTDGILLKMNDASDYELIDDIAHEWEQRTRLKLDFDEYRAVYEKDVNNYLIIPHGELYDEKGKPLWKCKGAWVKKLSDIDYNLAIINRALVDYMVHGVPVEDTINGCNDLREFQMIVKASSKYQGLMYGGELLKERIVRVFASKRCHRGIAKVTKAGKEVKVADTPVQCFIDNDNVRGKPCPDELDRQWYIDVAQGRLDKFLSSPTLF